MKLGRLLFVTIALGLCLAVLLLVFLWLAGVPNMKEQPRYEPLEEIPPTIPPAGAVPVSVTRTPTSPPVTIDFLELGRERFHVYCAPCHGPAGFGDGIIVQHGFPQPPSLHSRRLREVSDMHIWSAITNGAGVMYPYADRVDPEERWAIVHYIRVLQLAFEGEEQ